MNPLGGNAVVEDGQIVIRVSIDALPVIVHGAWAANNWQERGWTVTDPQQFAKEVVCELNTEKEDGSTPVHRLFDAAILEAIEQGAEGIEEHRSGCAE